MRIFLAIVFSVLISGFVVGNSPVAVAQSNCDAEFEAAIEARARLEAMRELEVAQTFILKPDSVLEYSCFAFHMTALEDGVNQIFSDNVASTILFKQPPDTFIPQDDGSTFSQYHDEISQIRVTARHTGQQIVQFGPNPPRFPPGALLSSGLDNALTGLVRPSWFNFLTNSYGHIYGGGAFNNIAASSSPCGAMTAVWDAAKCTNFDKGSFRSFIEHITDDRRSLPLPCNNPERNTQWADNYIAWQTVQPGSAGGVEPVVLYLDRLDPDECANHTPLQTGVRVFREDRPVEIHDDAFCPAPGCFYNGAACVPSQY